MPQGPACCCLQTLLCQPGPAQGTQAALGPGWHRTLCSGTGWKRAGTDFISTTETYRVLHLTDTAPS